MGLLSVILGFLNIRSSNAEAQSGGYSISQPVVMVPGTGATVDRFDTLIEELSQTYADLDVLKITVAEDGKITSTGSIAETSQHPVIVIGFSDSSDESLAKQGAWFQSALRYASQRYAFASYDYLGHSNGGLVITRYLENDLQPQDPTLQKMITLGTPYNYTEWGDNADSQQFTTVKNTTSQLQDYLDKQKLIPSDLVMVNIAGIQDGQNTDGTVPLTSVLSGRLIYGQVADYQEITVAAGHSQLVTNEAVQQEILSLFWGTSTSKL